ncbi:hypothetical protein PMSD_25120 [Paenibacillus macquariensis subsp. defensor]|nr:hypothetical protein PMSD_25120 [Paenibacillus macquariensis subsp. defensor]
MVWLQALSQGTDLLIASPIQNYDQNFVTEVTIEGQEPSIYASVLSWIDGKHIEGVRNSDQAKKLGRLLGVMHNYSIEWKAPLNFSRPKYDLEYISKNCLDGIGKYR